MFSVGICGREMAEEVVILWISTMSTLPTFAGDYKDFFARQIWRVHDGKDQAVKVCLQSFWAFSRNVWRRMAVKSIYQWVIYLCVKKLKYHMVILWKLSLSNLPINWPCLWLKPQCYSGRFYQKTNSGCGLLRTKILYSTFPLLWNEQKEFQ